MVRLKAVLQIDIDRLTSDVFQFHNGSIKSKKQARNPVAKGPQFQFHNGSIKRPPMPMMPRHVPSFNSTMVRLKEAQRLLPNDQFERFNSTMVRLKACTEVHSIQTLRCFNSTMVRLKERLGACGIACEWCFNSTMVRLKARKIN